MTDLIMPAKQLAEKSRGLARAARLSADEAAWVGDMEAAARSDRAKAIYLADADRLEAIDPDELIPLF